MKFLPVRCKKCNKISHYIEGNNNKATSNSVICPQCYFGRTPKKIQSAKKKTKKKKKPSASAGVRLDIHEKYYFRSKMEANFARILNNIKCQWSYEEKTFMFHGRQQKPYMYIMDFEIKGSRSKLLPNGYYEIKGYMNKDSKTKLKLLGKHYPEEKKKTIVVVSKYNKSAIKFLETTKYDYRFIEDLKSKIEVENWE